MKQTILKTENFNEILKFANKEHSFFQEERLFVLLRFFEMKGTKGIERYSDYRIILSHGILIGLKWAGKPRKTAIAIKSIILKPVNKQNHEI